MSIKNVILTVPHGFTDPNNNERHSDRRALAVGEKFKAALEGKFNVLYLPNTDILRKDYDLNRAESEGTQFHQTLNKILNDADPSNTVLLDIHSFPNIPDVWEPNDGIGDNIYKFVFLESESCPDLNSVFTNIDSSYIFHPSTRNFIISKAIAKGINSILLEFNEDSTVLTDNDINTFISVVTARLQILTSVKVSYLYTNGVTSRRLKFIAVSILIIVVIYLIYVLFLHKYVHHLVPSMELLSQNVEYHDFGNTNALHKLFILASVHGNEPAGHVALDQMMNSGEMNTLANNNNLFIRVINNPNPFGLRYGTRWQPNPTKPDINRNFSGNGDDSVTQSILTLSKGFDLILDFHEGWGFYSDKNGSVGSTLAPTSTQLAEQVAVNAVNLINTKITDPRKKFVVRDRDSCEITTTFACNQENINQPYILIETSGQNDIQPINIRVDQVHDVIITAIGMLKS